MKGILLIPALLVLALLWVAFDEEAGIRPWLHLRGELHDARDRIDSLPAVNHQPEFAVHCITEAADQAVYDGALAMAWTAIDLALDPKESKRLMAGH